MFEVLATNQLMASRLSACVGGDYHYPVPELESPHTGTVPVPDHSLAPGGRGQLVQSWSFLSALSGRF